MNTKLFLGVKFLLYDWWLLSSLCQGEHNFFVGQNYLWTKRMHDICDITLANMYLSCLKINIISYQICILWNVIERCIISNVGPNTDHAPLILRLNIFVVARKWICWLSDPSVFQEFLLIFAGILSFIVPGCMYYLILVPFYNCMLVFHHSPTKNTHGR